MAAQFRILGELGYTDIIVRHLTNDQPKALGSLERLETVRGAGLAALRGERASTALRALRKKRWRCTRR